MNPALRLTFLTALLALSSISSARAGGSSEPNAPLAPKLEADSSLLLPDYDDFKSRLENMNGIWLTKVRTPLFARRVMHDCGMRTFWTAQRQTIDVRFVRQSDGALRADVKGESARDQDRVSLHLSDRKCQQSYARWQLAKAVGNSRRSESRATQEQRLGAKRDAELAKDKAAAEEKLKRDLDKALVRFNDRNDRGEPAYAAEALERDKSAATERYNRSISDSNIRANKRHEGMARIGERFADSSSQAERALAQSTVYAE